MGASEKEPESETDEEKEEQGEEEDSEKPASSIHIQILSRLYDFATITFCSNCRVSYCPKNKVYKLRDNHWIQQIICWLLQTGLLIRGLLEIRDAYDFLVLDYCRPHPWAIFVFKISVWFTPFLCLRHNWIDRRGVSLYLAELQAPEIACIFVRDKFSAKRDRKAKFWLYLHALLTTILVIAWFFSSWSGSGAVDISKVYEMSSKRVNNVFGVNLDSDSGSELDSADSRFLAYLMVVPTLGLILLELNFWIVMHIGHVIFMGFSICSYRLTKEIRAFINTEEYNEMSTKQLEAAFSLFETFRNVQKRRDHLTRPFSWSCLVLVISYTITAMYMDMSENARVPAVAKFGLIYYGLEIFVCNMHRPELLIDTAFVLMNIKNSAKLHSKNSNPKSSKTNKAVSSSTTKKYLHP